MCIANQVAEKNVSGILCSLIMLNKDVKIEVDSPNNLTRDVIGAGVKDALWEYDRKLYSALQDAQKKIICWPEKKPGEQNIWEITLQLVSR